MPSVTWATKADLGIIPMVHEKSRKDFRPPPTIEDDFRRLLAHDVPHVNYTFELIHDWYTAHGDKRILKIFANQDDSDDVDLDLAHQLTEITVSGDIPQIYGYEVVDGDLIAEEMDLPYSPVLLRAQ